MKCKLWIAILAIMTSVCLVHAQENIATQTVKGTIIDQESSMPLFGVSVALLNAEEVRGATTDLDGRFIIENVPVGRNSFEITYIGYEPIVLQDILLTAGKALDLNIKMEEAIYELGVVEVTANDGGNEALNEMATLSSRTISVEETQRYAASVSDPARMASVFGGVTNAGDDISNEISIRGNSPKGILWRLEGIEIPNPNHFGSLGSSGGGISMLSSSALSTSDFYTGAFPAEFGNASSGVFDIKLRKGNDSQREHTFKFGLLGIEAATEGPFSKKSKASYLFNYRYSTFALLSTFYNPLGDVLPKYQDANYKINIPTKKAGTFGIFGIAGENSGSREAEADSTKWVYFDDNVTFIEKQKVLVNGVSHFYPIGENAYLKTIAMHSLNNYKDEYKRLIAEDNYREEVFDYTTFNEQTGRVSTMYNQKINAKNTFRVGGIYSYNSYKYDYNFKRRDSTTFVNLINGQGNASMIQGYGQWKNRPHKNLTLLAGVHGTYLNFNQTFSIEPRVSAKWDFAPKQNVSLALGLHSKPEHTSTYLLEVDLGDGLPKTTPNKELEIPKSAQAVLGYQFQTNKGINLTVEMYYQHLYDVPVTSDSSAYSSVNSGSIWGLVGRPPLVSEGLGANYGVDVSIQRNFKNRYYYLASGSIYNSQFKALDGNWYNTKFNGNYNLNLLGGKEFGFKKNDNILGFNGKFVLNGGIRFNEIDLEASKEAGYTQYLEGGIMEDRSGPYYRFDLGVSYTINRKKATHSIMFDIQNVTNRLNIYEKYYNASSEQIDAFTQTGIFPFFNYKIEFQTR